MPDSFDWRIIDRKLAGESSPADDATLRAWLAANPRRAELYDALIAAADSGDRERWNVDAAWSRTAARMDGSAARHSLELHPGGVPARRRIAPRWIAAGALAAAVVLALIWPAGTGHVAVPRASAAMHEVVAANGQQTRVTLHDGTRVVLNAGSRMRYASDFRRGPRDVELDGEAYFDVAHDATRPFRVHARGSLAEDLGTRFVVRAYRDAPRVEVAVEQGRVALRRDADHTPARELGAGQLGRVAPDGAVAVQDIGDVDRWLSWTRGALVLDGLTLAEAAAEIGRRYDARIVVADASLRDRRISARFHEDSLAHVLDAVTLAVGARWIREGQHVLIARVAP